MDDRIVFSTSGSGGDSFINTVKLYNLAKESEDIWVYHYTKHTDMHPLIKDIYGIMPSIDVEFVPERWTEPNAIASHFDIMEQWLDIEPFPDFEFKDDLDYEYTTYSPKSGKRSEDWRVVPEDEIPEDALEVSPDKCPAIKNAFIKIANSKSFIGYQGLLCYFALSQKIPTTVYIGPEHEVEAFKRRVLPEWWEFVTEIKRT